MSLLFSSFNNKRSATMKKKPRFNIELFTGIIYRHTSADKRAAIRCDYVYCPDDQAELVLDSTKFSELFENMSHKFGLVVLIAVLKKEQLISPSRDLKQFITMMKYLHRRGFRIQITPAVGDSSDDKECVGFDLYRERPSIRFHKGRSYAIYKFKTPLPLKFLFSDKGHDYTPPIVKGTTYTA